MMVARRRQRYFALPKKEGGCPYSNDKPSFFIRQSLSPSISSQKGVSSHEPRAKKREWQLCSMCSR